MTDEYRIDTAVMLSMCDHSGRLSVTGTLDLFMDVATLHEEASGFGVFTMKEKAFTGS